MRLRSSGFGDPCFKCARVRHAQERKHVYMQVERPLQWFLRLFDEFVPYKDETRSALILAVRSIVDPTCKRVGGQYLATVWVATHCIHAP
jgi:hypothetical protein